MTFELRTMFQKVVGIIKWLVIIHGLNLRISRNGLHIVQVAKNHTQYYKNNTRISILSLGLLLAIVLGMTQIDIANAFVQNVIVNINQGQYSGDYGVLLKNLDTGLYTLDYYDTAYVAIEGYISSSYGEELQACIMDMSTQDISCDYQYANSPNNYLDFYVDMDYANSLD